MRSYSQECFCRGAWLSFSVIIRNGVVEMTLAILFERTTNGNEREKKKKKMGGNGLFAHISNASREKIYICKLVLTRQ